MKYSGIYVEEDKSNTRMAILLQRDTIQLLSEGGKGSNRTKISKSLQIFVDLLLFGTVFTGRTNCGTSNTTPST